MKFKSFVCLFLILCFACICCEALEMTPGLNVLTGTGAPFDFEGDVSGVVFSGTPTDTENAVVTYATAANSQNKAAAVANNKNYFYFTDFPTIEKERPVNYSYDYVYGGQLRVLVNGDTSGFQALLCNYISGGKTTEWAKKPYAVNGRKSIDGLTNGGDLKYTGSEDITNLSFMNYSATAATSYFDNISVVPAYKISYDVNGGSGSVADEYTFDSSFTLNDGAGICKAGCIFKGWALAADSTEFQSTAVMTPGKDLTVYAVWEDNPDDTIKTVELYDGNTLRAFYNVVSGKNRTLPDLEMVDGKVLYGWQTADGKVLHGYNIVQVTDHMKLYAVWKDAELKPGINAFSNGDFEGTELDVRPSHGYLSIVTDTDGNRILEYVRGSGYASIQHYVPWENGRKYKVGYKFRANYKAGIASNARYFEAVTAEDGTTSTKYDHLFGQTTANADTWFTYSTTYTFSKDDYIADTKDAISFYYNPNADKKGGTVYYDDLEFIPYYKVTYHADGAENVPAAEYFLDGDYTVSVAVPTKPGYIFMGWSLTENGIDEVTKVSPVPGCDIELYAIWENISAANAITYRYTSDVPGIANGTIAIACPDEVASHTSIEVYFGDNNGIMEGYTPFANITLTDGAASYAVTGNRGFAPGATRLAFVFKGEGLEDIIYWHTIPAEHRLNVQDHTLKFKFWATSDSHLGGANYNSDYWPEMTVNRNNAMADIFASDADFMFINGDVSNYGTEKYADVLQSYLDDKMNNEGYNKNSIPVFLTNGNHEYMNTDNANGGFDFDSIQKVILGQLDYIKENYPDITISHDGESMWYSADIMGAKFIFLSSPEEKAEGNKHTYTLSDAQLHFLDEQLYESEYSNKTAFVVTHVPLSQYVPADSATGYQAGITNTSAVESILAMHPNVLFCTGHSHSDIGDEDSHFVVAGDMTSKFTHLNDGCLVWIDPTDGIGENGTKYIKSYSTGMYIEVYNDMIVIRGRKFISNSLYFGHAVYIIPTQDSNRQVVSAQIDGILSVGNTVSADIGEEDAENFTFNWIVDGEIVSTQQTWTIDKNEYAGKHVYLRAIDKDGYYATTKSDYTVSTVTFGDKLESPVCAELVFDEAAAENAVVLVAIYNDSKQLIGIKFVPSVTQSITVTADKSTDAKSAKAFAFEALSSLKPLCESAEAAMA